MEYDFLPEDALMDNPTLILVLNSVLMPYDLGTLAVLSLSKEVSTEREREGGRGLNQGGDLLAEME